MRSWDEGLTAGITSHMQNHRGCSQLEVKEDSILTVSYISYVPLEHTLRHFRRGTEVFKLFPGHSYLSITND